MEEGEEAALAMPSSAINANRIKINFVLLSKSCETLATGRSREQRAGIMPTSSSGRAGGGRGEETPQLLS